VNGLIDETALWSRPLSATEVKTLATLSGELISYDPAVITSKSLNATSIDGVSATWLSQGTITVSLSTDGGKTWCQW
jgi:Neuraminidase (sialidase)